MQHAIMTTAALVGYRALAAAPGARNIPIAIQLYSIRDECAKDMDGALGAVAKWGCNGVEFAGYHQYSGKPKALRAKLDSLGLKVAATHLATDSLRGDALNQAIEFHQEIGCKYLIVAHDDALTDPEKSRDLAGWFNDTADLLKPHGMACGYHNHQAEFAKTDHSNWWEIFADRTNPQVVLQLDCGWAAAAGEDCADLMKRHPGRMKVVHLKPTVFDGVTDKKAIFGQDSVNWGPVLTACQEFGGTEWFTLEQEVYPDGKAPLECTALSLSALKKSVYAAR